MGFFDKFKDGIKGPLAIGAKISEGVQTAASTAATVKAKVDLINADLDGDGKTQVQNIKEQGGKIAHRAFGDAALKHPVPGETPEQKAAREKLLAEEKTTAKLIAKTRDEWTEEARFYQVEGLVLFALVTGFTKALLLNPNDAAEGKAVA